MSVFRTVGGTAVETIAPDKKKAFREATTVFVGAVLGVCECV